MKVLELFGVVDANEGEYEEDGNGESWYLDNIDGPSIGGKPVIAAFNDTFDRDSGPLTVLLAHDGDQALYHGKAWATEGDHGYSTLTPGSGPDMWVGVTDHGQPTDLLAKLTALDRQTVYLRIDDGPPLHHDQHAASDPATRST